MIKCACGADLTGRLDSPNIRVRDWWPHVPGPAARYRAECRVCGRSSSTCRTAKESAVSDLYDEHASY